LRKITLGWKKINGEATLENIYIETKERNIALTKRERKKGRTATLFRLVKKTGTVRRKWKDTKPLRN